MRKHRRPKHSYYRKPAIKPEPAGILTQDDLDRRFEQLHVRLMLWRKWLLLNNHEDRAEHLITTIKLKNQAMEDRDYSKITHYKRVLTKLEEDYHHCYPRAVMPDNCRLSPITTSQPK